MTKKKEGKNIPLPILILICAVLLFSMYLSLSTLALAIWGDSFPVAGLLMDDFPFVESLVIGWGESEITLLVPEGIFAGKK